MRETLLPEPALKRAREMILTEGAPCVFLRDGRIVKAGEGTGVGPLITAWEREPELLCGAVIVDKIVGRAAAMLAVLGGAAGVYGLTMSASARDYLSACGIPAEAEVCTERILNRSGTGWCPMEQAVLDIDDPAEGYRKLKETMRRLAAG
jgi:hypothetical protein